MSSSRQLYAEQKSKLCDRVLLTLGSFGQIANSIGKGGRADQVRSVPQKGDFLQLIRVSISFITFTEVVHAR